MKRYFTHYWSNETCEHQKVKSQTELLNHIAGNQFKKRKVNIGDEIYVVTVIKGKLYLWGKLVVGKICNSNEAARILGCQPQDLWPADEHIIASAVTLAKFDIEVSSELTKQLKFKSNKTLKPLYFTSSEYLDKQTLRTVRELDFSSALELDKLLTPLQEILFISDEEVFPEEIASHKIYYEGATKQVRVNRYERNAKARKDCIEYYGLDCFVCDFNFKNFYGDMGRNFIHVHHLKPISEIGEGYKLDPIKDLRPVCPNCHAMLHKRQPPYTIEEMRKLLLKSRNAL